MKQLNAAGVVDWKAIAIQGVLPLVVAAGLLLAPASGGAWTVHVQNWCHTTKTMVVYSYGAEIGRTTIEAYSDANRNNYRKDIPLPGAMCPTKLVVLNDQGQYELEQYTAQFPLIEGTPTCWDVTAEIISVGGGYWACTLQLD